MMHNQRTPGMAGNGAELIPLEEEEIKRTVAFYGSERWFEKLHGAGVAAEVLPRLPGPSNPATRSTNPNDEKGPWILSVLCLTENQERHATCAAFPPDWTWAQCAEVALDFSQFCGKEIAATRVVAHMVPMVDAGN